MLNNPNWNVHTDYEVHHVFKPGAANQIVSTIPYDYVVTQAMMDWGLDPDNGAYNASTNTVDITKVLLGSEGETSGITAKKRISIMIDAVTDDSLSLDFKDLYGAPWFQTGVASTNQLDIYCRSPFTFLGRAYTTYIHNDKTCKVCITSSTISTDTLYIGYMVCPSTFSWSGYLYYEENSSDVLPTGHVEHTAWMTNKVPVQVADITDIADITPASFITHDDVIAPPEVDNTSFTKIQEILGKDLLPYLVISYSSGYNKFFPLILINTDCELVFRDETGKRNYSLVDGTKTGDTEETYGNGIPVGSKGWVVEEDYPEIILFPGSGASQPEIYKLLKENVATKGLPKLQYASGAQTTFIEYSYYTIYSGEYNFFWQFTSGGTTTTLYMNAQGTWAIS